MSTTKHDVALRFSDVTVTYENSDEPALKNLSFEVKPGEFVGLMGANGAGKSTIAFCALGIIPHHLDAAIEGNIEVLGLNTKTTSICTITEQGVGIVFQEPDLQLISINAELEVAFALENRGIELEEMQKRVAHALEQVRLTGFEKRPPDQLSGGQKQALCIAAALALRPRLLVLDEPTSQLDPIGSNMVFEMMKRLNQEYGIAMLVMEHKADLLAEYSDRIIVIDQGRKVLDGTPPAVFSHVADLKQQGIPVPQVADLINTMDWGSQFNPSNFPATEGVICDYLSRRLERGAL